MTSDMPALGGSALPPEVLRDVWHRNTEHLEQLKAEWETDADHYYITLAGPGVGINLEIPFAPIPATPEIAVEWCNRTLAMRPESIEERHLQWQWIEQNMPYLAEFVHALQDSHGTLALLHAESQIREWRSAETVHDLLGERVQATAADESASSYAAKWVEESLNIAMTASCKALEEFFDDDVERWERLLLLQLSAKYGAK